MPKMGMRHYILCVILNMSIVSHVLSFPEYNQKIPNGDNVVHNGESWPAVGHTRRNSGAGPENPFGIAFANAGYFWNLQLCEEDSDGDGHSNGEELGDPDCTWSVGATPSRTQNITHPGFAKGEGVNDQVVFKFRPATTMFIGGSMAITIIGAWAMKRPRSWLWKICWPCLKNWNIANLFGVGLVLVGLIACSIVLVTELTIRASMLALGAATGLASALPIWWAFLQKGVHTIMGMGREAAWRIHIVFGIIALSFGLAHGVLALISEGSDIFGNFGWVSGFAGLVLMFIGVLPAFAHILAFKIITYNRFKVLHFMSLFGYGLTLVHMLDNFRNGSADIAAVVFNVMALTSYLFQRLCMTSLVRQVALMRAEITNEPHCKYLILHLKAPGFKYNPGQWCLLRVPSISAVAHPFTIVPGGNEGHMQLFVKVSGQFTSQLAKACMSIKSTALLMEAQGPFGMPPLPTQDINAMVFVLGGIGVTPALSLVAEASRMYGDQVRVYWNLKSAELLKKSAPFLAPHLKPEFQCIRITESQPKQPPDNEAQGVEALPFDAQKDREDLDKWLAATAADFVYNGTAKALLFVCGPSDLVKATLKAAQSSEKTTGVAWGLHVEQFDLPLQPMRCKFPWLQLQRPLGFCRKPQLLHGAKVADPTEGVIAV